MSKIVIYLANKNYSSWSMRPWLALKQTGAAFEEEVIPLDEATTREEILKRSPSGKLPALKDGDTLVWDSLAIGEYLAERFPQSGLWPADPAARAYARSISAEMHSGFMGVRLNMPMNMRASKPGKGMGTGTQDDINRITVIWRTCRERHGKSGAFLFGAFSLADCMYAPIVSRFTTYQVKLDDVSEAYRQAVFAHGPFQEWMAAAKNEPWIIPKYEI